MSKKFIIVVGFILFLILAFEVYYRKTSGGWNVFIPPAKFHCFNREYHSSKHPLQKMIETKKPLSKIQIDNPFWNGRVFSAVPKSATVPTVLYLRVSRNLYQSYELSGGP